MGRVLRSGAFLVVAALLGLAGGAAAPKPPSLTGWQSVEYGALVDRRQPSHSGESVGALLARLAGRPAPAAGRVPDDATAHVLLDPLLEPYAFVLSDALDTRLGLASRPFVDVGRLYPPGTAQPAWAALLRERRYVVESDGAGNVRCMLPWTAGEGSAAGGDGTAAPAIDDARAAREAWDAAWPVLRHVFAAERRRLAGKPLQVAARAYLHHPARTTFFWTGAAFDATVDDTRPRGERPPLDLALWQRFLDRGDLLEGARLTAEGGLVPLGSESASRPRLAGRPLTLADLAVAYRAVFHGGAGQPYMSLDRGFAPQASLVNYGGRLADTALGATCLACDIRFKTFSQGIDIQTGRDVRDEVRHDIPGFATHLERFAADPAARTTPAQQTRLWFYPDGVELTLSEQGDVLVMRRARMGAAAERLGAEGAPPPPWTKATTQAIDRDYEKLSKRFPEMADLDQAVRLLSLFAWLAQVRGEGLLLPDLDALLALELPAASTPRSFPQLLTANAVPADGGSGAVDVFAQTTAGAALTRLAPRGGRPLPAVQRAQRALAALDASRAEEQPAAAALRDLLARAPGDDALDQAAYDAERVRMHRFVLTTLHRDAREVLTRRDTAGEKLRVFSAAIGGIDLGMGQAVARAGRRGGRPAFGLAGARAAAPGGSGGGGATRAALEPREAWRHDPEGLPALMLPDHGLADADWPRVSGKQGEAARAFPGGWIQRAVVAELPVGWEQVVLDADGIDADVRRVLRDRDARVVRFDRLAAGRVLRYALDAGGSRLGVHPLDEALHPAMAALAAAPPAQRALAAPATGAPPPAAVFVDFPAGGSEAEKVRVRLGTPDGRSLEAPLPRAALQRLVLGHDVDVQAGRPLPGFAPLPPGAADARRAMVFAVPAQVARPWLEPAAPLPGEEDPFVVARALGAWWAGERRPAVVGVDRAASPARWAAAPVLDGPVPLVAADAPGAAELRAAWTAGPASASLAGAPAARLVVLVSDAPADQLAAEVAAYARDPRRKGSYLAVWPLAGTLRDDVVAAALGAGLAGVGLAEPPATGPAWPQRALAAFGTQLAAGRGVRPEELGGPFLWCF